MTQPTLNVLLNDTEARRTVPRWPEVRVIRRPLLSVARRAQNIFVLSRVTGLPDVAEFVSIANRRHQLRALFVRQDLDLRWLPRLLDQAHLRAIRNMLVHDDPALPRRVLAAWRHGAQSALIADAKAIGDSLLVLSCAMEVRQIAFDRIRELKGMPAPLRREFHIDEDGSCIHWPAGDIHLDLDDLRAAVDQEFRARLIQKRLAHDREYGMGIARVRRSNGLLQTQIRDLSERQVRRIEGGSTVSLSALKRLARAHGMRLDDYMDAVAEEVLRYRTGARGPADRHSR